jgi:glycosyltransferase involved in cell wall biosynthesis
VGARLALVGTQTETFVDWFEVWPFAFWLEYTGLVSGTIGYIVQELCIRLTPNAFVFWKFTADRLRDHHHRGQMRVLAGLLPAEARKAEPNFETTAPPIVLFAGRHIKDKGVRHLAGALCQARKQLPDLRLVIAGEGPETPFITQQLRDLDLLDAVDIVGKVSDEELARLISTAACVIVASVREGYGMMVVESAAHGTPCVVAGHPENAATGHILQGVNGFVVEPTDDGLAGGILRSVDEGRPLRESTAAWYSTNSSSMGIDAAISEVVEAYAEDMALRP